MREGPESIGQIKPSDRKVALFLFGLLDGTLEEHSVLLYPVHTREESFLLQRQPRVVSRHCRKPGCNGTGEELVQCGEERDWAEIAVVICRPFFVHRDGASCLPRRWDTQSPHCAVEHFK